VFSLFGVYNLYFIVTIQELRNLFEKLDVDRDDRVSFDEFVRGLFQYTAPVSLCATPRSIVGTPTPRSMSAQKKIKPPASTEERMTPSIMQGSGASGLFSVLDGENTG
jgi:hypothetical protein